MQFPLSLCMGRADSTVPCLASRILQKLRRTFFRVVYCVAIHRPYIKYCPVYCALYTARITANMISCNFRCRSAWAVQTALSHASLLGYCKNSVEHFFAWSTALQSTGRKVLSCVLRLVIHRRLRGLVFSFQQKSQKTGVLLKKCNKKH